MKKIMALLAVMVVSLAGCGGGGSSSSAVQSSNADQSNTSQASTPSESGAGTPVTAVSPDAVADNMNSADGTYEIAFVTDIGQLKDQSFNEGTWNGVKLYAHNNGLTYKYYQPANGNEATDDDRYDAMKAAAEAGAKVVVCAGFLQEASLTRAAADFPEVMFVFIDGYPLNGADGNPLSNVAAIAFQEEQCGYFAGYAVVKEGFTKLGFSGGGGGTNPAVNKYGYGFVQGANAAAAEMGVQVDINYSFQFGSSYSASPELQTMCNGWYENGVEVIFACGGSMFQSVAAAASANDGFVVGVDTDQSGDSDTVITSAMKGIGEAAQYAIGKFYDGTWADIGGVATTLGVNDDAVGIPTDTWSMSTYTVEQYQQNLESVKSGQVVVDGDYEKLESTEWSNVTLNII